MSADISTPAECIGCDSNARSSISTRLICFRLRLLVCPNPRRLHHQRQSTFRDSKSFVVICNYTSTIRSLTTTTSATS
ncbi:hypothetical protein VKT23_019663 [Stygiomarasmius scandens]|uniref:Uncharacterized protein n=1 Tax=Marasmiellus scandens TaxID=2682957 RepID=A0ABR1INP7_9AGAR